MNKPALAKIERQLNQGRIQEAHELCLKLCKKEKRMPQAWSLLGIINGRLGKLDEAEKCFRKVIALNPRAAEAYFNLAKTQTLLQRQQQAEQNYLKAIKLNPAFAQAYNNLGTLQAGLNKAAEAEQNLRRALEIQPDYPNPYRNLALLLQHQGRLDETEQLYRAALELQPGFSAVRGELADLLLQRRRYEDAEAQLHEALRFTPNDSELLIKLGKIHYLREAYKQAEACYRQALAHRPNHVEALIDLGAVQEKTGAPQQALDCYRKALALAPDNMRAHNNLAVALCLTGAYQEAVAAARQALALNPDSAESYNNLANALNRLGHLQEATEALLHSLRLQPDDAPAYANLGRILLQQGKSDESYACYRRAIELQPDLSGAHSSLLYAMNFRQQHSRTELFQAHCDWAAQHEQPLAKPDHYPNTPTPERRLRIGYVSPDFRGHSVAFFFEPILTHHDRDAVEVYCYSNVSNPDTTTQRLQALADGWRHCRGMPDTAMAQQIAADGIDILIDLTGHPADNRLPVFARQPAPVQVSYLGYPNTTGLQRIQYLMTDSHCDPAPEADAYYSETLLRLPQTFFCYQPPHESPAVTPAPVLKKGHITFASFNNLAKIGPEVVRLWAEVLKALPDATLNIQCRSLNDPPTRAEYAALFATHGIEPERIRFTAAQDFHSYLAAHGEVDILLDTFPWNGHTVSCHALWMGVPLITRCGDRHATRMGTSMLTNLGLDHCIATTDAEFIAAAVELARDPQQLNALRQQLRTRLQSSPLCDAAGFTRRLEGQYRDIWRRWCAERH